MTTNVETLDLHTATRVLNRCIEVCFDGQKFYAHAAANVRDTVLKEMFQRYSDQRASFLIALQGQLAKLGVTPENEGTFAGAARREMMEAWRAVEPSHRDARIVRECLFELEAALRVYSAANAVSKPMPVDLRVMLDEQQAALRIALQETRGRLNSH